MSEQTPSLAAEIETVKEIYAAINRNDIPAAMKFFDAQMEWIYRLIIRAAAGRTVGTRT